MASNGPPPRGSVRTLRHLAERQGLQRLAVRERRIGHRCLLDVSATRMGRSSHSHDGQGQR